MSITSAESFSALPADLDIAQAFDRSAPLYDGLYGGVKDYDGEFACYSIYLADGAPVVSGDRSIIEWGCGTGEFARRFQADGWDVLGIEPSESMVELARDKGLNVACGGLGSSNVKIGAKIATTYDLIELDETMRQLTRPRAAAIAPFAVLSYACAVAGDAALDSLAAALQQIRRKLLPGGRLVFDIVHRPGVEASLRPEESRVVNVGTHVVDRKFSKSWDAATGLLSIDAQYKVYDNTDNTGAGALLEEFSEQHVMRPFTYHQIYHALKAAGYRLDKVEGLNGRPADSDSWELVFFAEAASSE